MKKAIDDTAMQLSFQKINANVELLFWIGKVLPHFFRFFAQKDISVRFCDGGLKKKP